MAKTAATATRGVSRRTSPRVHDGFGAVRGRAPGITSETSPPLAGWKVRRVQSVDAALPPRPPLTQVSRPPKMQQLRGPRHYKLGARLTEFERSPHATASRRTQPPRLPVPGPRDRRPGQPSRVLGSA